MKINGHFTLRSALRLPQPKVVGLFLCLFFLLVGLSGQKVQGETASTHLFILSGQSNMARMDPTLTFIPAVETEFGPERVTVIHAAWGGQPISRWYKGWRSSSGEPADRSGDLYDRMMAEVKQAVGDRPVETVTFVWMQGERDALRRHGDVYKNSLLGLIQQLSDDLGRSDCHLVIGRLSDSASYKDWRMVRAAQMQVADDHPKAVWIDTDDLNSGLNEKGEEIHDDLHFSVEGYKMLGERFADAAIELIRKQMTP